MCFGGGGFNPFDPIGSAVGFYNGGGGGGPLPGIPTPFDIPQEDILSAVSPFAGGMYKAYDRGYLADPWANAGNLIDTWVDPNNMVGRSAGAVGDAFPSVFRNSTAQTIFDVLGGVVGSVVPWAGAAISGVGSELTQDWEGMTEEERRKKKNQKVMKGALTYLGGELFGGSGAEGAGDALGGGLSPELAAQAGAEYGYNAAGEGIGTAAFEGLSSGAGSTAADMGSDVGLSQLMSDPGVTGLGQGVNAETYYGDGFESLIDEGMVEGVEQTPGFGQSVLDTGQSVLGTAKEGISDAGSWVKGKTSGMLGSALKSPMTYLMAGNLLSNYLGAKSGQQAQQEATQDNRTWWQQNAYPNQALVQAKQTAAGSDLSSRLAEAKRRYMEDAARRGLRGGSLAGGLASMERSTMKDYSKLANELIQFQNTAQFAPQGTSMVATQTPEQSLYGSLGNTAGTLAGYYAYKNLL
jgi:hypothetical protein